MMRAMSSLFNRVALSVALLGTTATCNLAGPGASDLRIRNSGTLPLQSLTVHFPDASVDFGDVAPGATTDYRVVAGGVYYYAAYSFMYNGQRVDQPVIDWVGESPMKGERFTYAVQISDRPDGVYLMTVNVVRDR